MFRIVHSFKTREKRALLARLFDMNGKLIQIKSSVYHRVKLALLRVNAITSLVR